MAKMASYMPSRDLIESRQGSGGASGSKDGLVGIAQFVSPNGGCCVALQTLVWKRSPQIEFWAWPHYATTHVLGVVPWWTPSYLWHLILVWGASVLGRQH